MKTTTQRTVRIYALAMALMWSWALARPAAGQIASWSDWTPVPAPAIASDKAVAVAVFKERLWLFATDSSQQIQTNLFDGAQWGGWSAVPDGPVTDETPTVAEYDGNLFLFCKSSGARFPAGQILYRIYRGATDAWEPWTPVTTPSGTLTTGRAVAAVSHVGKLHLFFRSSSGQIAGTVFDGSAWLDATPMAGLMTDYAPVIGTWPVPLAGGSRDYYTLYLFGRGTDGQNHFNVEHLIAGTWLGWQVLPDPSGGSKVVSGSADFAPHLYVTGFDSVTHGIYDTRTDGVDIWENWTVAPAAGAVTDVGVAAVAFNGELYEFANLKGAAPLAGIQYRVGWSRPTFALVNMIPNSMSSEPYNDAAPDVAALATGGPDDQIIANALSYVGLAGGRAVNTFFTPSHGWRTWTEFQSFVRGDTNNPAATKWSSAGTAYTMMGGHATVAGQDHLLFNVSGSAATPSGLMFNAPFAGSQFPADPLPAIPDSFPSHASLEVLHAGAVDRLYVGFSNDNPSDSVDHGQTAWIRYSVDPGHATWNSVSIDRLLSSVGDSPPVVAAAKDGRVYALFNRYLGLSGLGDVVVVRDNSGGSGGFRDLPTPGTAGAGTVINTTTPNLPYQYPSRTLIPFYARSSGAIAVDPNDDNHVFVAYVYVSGSTPRLRILSSMDGGQHFSTLPLGGTPLEVPNVIGQALAVAENGTVGLLYKKYTGAAGSGSEIHFLQGFEFVAPDDRTLAAGPNLWPSGLDNISANHLDLEAAGNTFYGVFSFNNDPDAAHFPGGVRYQRSVKVGSTVRKNTTLSGHGMLVDTADHGVRNLSTDPFFFYEDSSTIRPLIWHAEDPNLPGKLHLGWSEDRHVSPKLPAFILESSPGANAPWSAANASISGSNGQFSVTVHMSGDQMFFRLRRPPPPTNTLYTVDALAAGSGALSPGGSLLANLNGSIVFTATPNTNNGVAAWYVDGTLAQSGGTTFTLGGIQANHSVSAVFAPLHDLGLTKLVEVPQGAPQPFYVPVGSNVVYSITVDNLGLEPVTGVTVLDPLPPGANFVSASSTQGTCTFSTNTVACVVGGLSPGASATITLTLSSPVAGMLTNSAFAFGDQPDADPSNNQADATVAIGLQTLISAGSTWRYLDDGSDRGTAWRSANFSDSAWNSGQAELGYGEGDEATQVGFGPSTTNRYITTYFRRTFDVVDPADFGGLLLKLKRDDGAIVYLNGVEVYRSNMPTGAVNYLTPAVNQVDGPDEAAFFATTLDPSLLLSGANMIAVEVHQESMASDDLSFDLELIGYLAAPRPPAILQQPPLSQSVTRGGPVSFGVHATGSSPLLYQWFHHNAAIPGATLSTLFISSAQDADAGTYAVQISNAFGAVYSDSAALTVLP